MRRRLNYTKKRKVGTAGKFDLPKDRHVVHVQCSVHACLFVYDIFTWEGRVVIGNGCAPKFSPISFGSVANLRGKNVAH